MTAKTSDQASEITEGNVAAMHIERAIKAHENNCDACQMIPLPCSIRVLYSQAHESLLLAGRFAHEKEERR